MLFVVFFTTKVLKEGSYCGGAQREMTKGKFR